MADKNTQSRCVAYYDWAEIKVRLRVCLNNKTFGTEEKDDCDKYTSISNWTPIWHASSSKGTGKQTATTSPQIESLSTREEPEEWAGEEEWSAPHQKGNY